MKRYEISKVVGHGSFSNVFKAINKVSREVVAIKRLNKKYESFEECRNLSEVKSLRRLNHRNIVKLIEVIKENDDLFLVLECMECNLYEMMQKREGRYFSESEIRTLCFQVLQGLDYMHKCDYFHRDIKPENILIAKDVAKIGDFGFARKISSKLLFTEYIATRWYRAPENLLHSSIYGSAIDMWAMGAIIAELFMLRPLFPGSTEIDQMHKICRIIGSPDYNNAWKEGLEFADVINFEFPKCSPMDLHAIIPSASDEAIHLISSLCSWDPKKRPTAAMALQHSFFRPMDCIRKTLNCVSSNRKSGNNGSYANLEVDTNRSWTTAYHQLAIKHNARYFASDVKTSSLIEKFARFNVS